MEAMRKISIKPGPPVEGNDFYGRESELKYAWQYYILNGVSMLLAAPRRIGKSSFSKRLLKMAEENGYKTLYLDLQGESTEGGFIDEDHFNSWDERLKEYYDFEGNARKILKLCAELPTGRSREDILANLAIRKGNIEKIESTLTQSLKMLKNDGYLIENSGKYAFRSPLLRDFWYNNFIK